MNLLKKNDLPSSMRCQDHGTNVPLSPNGFAFDEHMPFKCQSVCDGTGRPASTKTKPHRLSAMFTSRRLPVSDLSMKTRLRAANTGRTCCRCGRPSTLSSSTASTRATSASIESTTVTFQRSRISLSISMQRLIAKCGDRQSITTSIRSSDGSVRKEDLASEREELSRPPFKFRNSSDNILCYPRLRRPDNR